MRKRTGYALSGAGVLVALTGWALRSPEWVCFNGHLLEVWLLWVLLGAALLTLGVVLVVRTR
jgi:hypothetical protein